MVKFPLTYRDIDKTTRAEGQKITHFECVAYRYDAPQVEVAPIAVTAKAEPKKEVVAAKGVTPVEPVPTPKQISKKRKKKMFLKKRRM